MKKKGLLAKSLLVSVVVLALMVTAGYSLLCVNNEPLAAGQVETSAYAGRAEIKTSRNFEESKKTAESEAPPQAAGQAAVKDELSDDHNQEPAAGPALSSPAAADSSEASGGNQEPKEQKTDLPVAVNIPVTSGDAPAAGSNEPSAADGDRAAAASDTAPAIVQTALKAPVDYRSQQKAQNVQQNQADGEPALSSAPAWAEEPVVVEAKAPAVAAPVTYSYGQSAGYVFRIEVKVVNNGAENARNIVVSVPFLENSSPYQTTVLSSTNYGIVSSNGRLNTFEIGDLAPGESKSIVADFNVNVRTISINSTNDTVEKARSIFKQYAGSGNCRDLARAFINKANAEGIKAREVIGFARPRHGAMTAGSLQGARHSWAEFYVDGLGWIPVDLTFQYFASLPHTSHIVESYSDQSIKVNYTGGNLGATWSNSIL